LGAPGAAWVVDVGVGKVPLGAAKPRLLVAGVEG
jgi:hypothetical protein